MEHMHACMYVFSHTLIHTYTHAHAHTHAPTKHTLGIHITNVHTYTNTHRHTCNTHTDTHIQTYSQI